MTYLNDAKDALSYTSTEARRDNHKTFAIAALADEQRTANLIALMNSSDTSGADRARIMGMVLERLSVRTPEYAAFDED